MNRTFKLCLLTILGIVMTITPILANGWQIQKGEKLSYKIAFYSGLTGNIKGGEASISVAPQLVVINGKPTYHATLLGGTTGLIEWLYSVENRYESYMDVNSGAPLLFKQQVIENKYNRKDSIIFDQKNKIAKNISRDQTTKIENNTHDFVSMIYHVRSLDVSKMKKGQSITIPFYSSGDLIKSKVVFAGVEKISVNGKQIECYAFKPELPEGKVFKKDYPATIWFSTDSKRLPMMIEARIKVGRIKMELLKVN